jgi:hypothetical protein
MLYVGRRQSSAVLLLLFAAWVLAPFGALVWAWLASKSWSCTTRATLHALMLILALASLAIYGEMGLGPPRAKPAFAFLVVPATSLLLIATTLSIGALVAGRGSRRPT